MPSIRSLRVALQVAPEVESRLKAHWGTAWQNKLEHALQEAVDALVDSEIAAIPRFARNDNPSHSERGEESPEICVYLTTDAEIRELNRAYRGVDRATDVLSFGYLPSPSVLLAHGVGEGVGNSPSPTRWERGAEGEGYLPPHNDALSPSPTAWERGAGGEGEVESPLGDIVISLETAERQAALNQHDLLTELLMLALHGTLHLMGYDDSTETERAMMNARAVAVLRTLGYEAREEWYSRYEDA